MNRAPIFLQRCGRRVFAAAAKAAAWHRLPGNRPGPVPLLSRNRLVVDKKSPICEELHSENFMLKFLNWENA